MSEWINNHPLDDYFYGYVALGLLVFIIVSEYIIPIITVIFEAIKSKKAKGKITEPPSEDIE